LRFERDDLAQIGAGDRRFAYEVSGAFFRDVATRAQAGRQEQSRILRLENQACPRLGAGQRKLRQRD